jgi:hypothetical protein
MIILSIWTPGHLLYLRDRLFFGVFSIIWPRGFLVCCKHFFSHGFHHGDVQRCQRLAEAIMYVGGGPRAGVNQVKAVIWDPDGGCWIRLLGMAVRWAEVFSIIGLPPCAQYIELQCGKYTLAMDVVIGHNKPPLLLKIKDEMLVQRPLKRRRLLVEIKVEIKIKLSSPDPC